ncbi:MAG: rod shape-determining protein MreD [Hyphomicrobiaceae bacterium]
MRVGAHARLKPLTSVVPALSLIVFALIATLPWGLSADVAYLPPLLVLALIFCWSVRYPGLMPPLLVFLAGIGVDVVTASPIGFWSFLFLAGYAAALRVSRFAQDRPTITMILTYPVVALLIGALAWLFASVYFSRFMEWQPVMESLKIAVLACPAIAWLTRLLNGLMVAAPAAGSHTAETA